MNVICLPVEAKPADVTPGKIVHDSYQLLLGSVELVGSDNAVVTGEYGSLRFPLVACLPMVRQGLNEGRSLTQDHAVLSPLLEALYEGLGEPVQPAIAVPLLSRGKDRCWRVRPAICIGCRNCFNAIAGPLQPQARWRRR